MKDYEEVLKRLAASTRVPGHQERAHEALRDTVADALAGVGAGPGAGLGAGPSSGSGAGARERSLPGVLRVVDAGSFQHGTAVRGASRFDVFVVLDGGRPKSLARALQGIRTTVQDARIDALLTTTSDSVLVDAPDLRRDAAPDGDDHDHGDASDGDSDVDAGDGNGTGRGPDDGGENAEPGPRLRLIPAYEAPGDAGSSLVAVPDAARRWVLTRPGARGQLIERIDGPDGHLGTLIRLVLLWKHRNGVPVSSYYLETAVIRQALRQPSFNLLWDLCWLFEQTAQDDLMNLPDLSSPSQVQRVRAADTLGRRIEAQVPLDAAAAHARAAVNGFLDDDEAAVDARLDALFGGDVTSG